MALLTHLLEKATANKRRQATARRRRQTPHIEQARIDYMALYAIAWRRMIAQPGVNRRLACRRRRRRRRQRSVVYRQAPLSPPVAPTAYKSAADLANGRRRLGGVWGGVLLCADLETQAA